VSKAKSGERAPKRPSATQRQSSQREVADTELQSRVGMAVRLARTARKMTQRELARQVGRSQNFVHSLERGSSDPGIVALIRIAERLEVDVDVFLAPVLPRRKSAGQPDKQLHDKAQQLLNTILRTMGESHGEGRGGQ
jgi:transcriptional regulator with XRE-family HTH domain